MTSDLHSPRNSAADKSRLALKETAGSASGVDGGWWPRSADPAVEFPALIAALAGHGVPVRRVTYNLDAWEPAERRFTVDGELVRMEGFHSVPAHIVTMIGPDRSRIRLLVVPSGTADGTAREALRAAGDTASTATGSEILAAERDSAPTPIDNARSRRGGGRPSRSTPTAGKTGS